MPTTELTALRGTVSETIVYRFAENPLCAAAAPPTRNTASHRLFTRVTNATGTTHTAQTRKVILRATLTLAPRRISHEDNPPPAILPASAIR